MVPLCSTHVEKSLLGQHVGDLGSELNAGGTTATNNEGQERTAFLRGRGRERCFLEVV